MKYLKSIILISLAILLLGSCEDYLKQETFSDLTTANFYQKESDAIAGIYAAYAQLNGAMGARYHFMIELTGDGVTTKRPNNHRRGEMDIHDFGTDNQIVRDVYIRTYEPILNANSVLDNVDNVTEISESARAMIKGEARFVRSLSYFNLVRIYQHVPLVTSAQIDVNELNVAKTNADEIYNFLIQDLTQAATDMPEQAPEFGRASKGAAQALLAKVHLTRAKTGFSPNPADDYSSAATLLSAVITSGVYDLNPDLRNLYGLEDWASGESDNEWIFTIQATSDGGQNNDVSYHAAPPELPTPSGWHNYHGEAPFYLEYDSVDARREVFYITEYILPTGDTLNFDINDMAGDDWDKDGPVLSRYVDIFDNGGGVGRDIAVLKYSDVLLLYAEAILERDGAPNADAIDMVNMVRRRAHDYDPSATSPFDLPASMSYDDFRKELYMERRKELLFEGHAFMDGLRFWDLYKEAVEASSRYVFPGQDNLINAVPKAEINLTDRSKVFPIPGSALVTNPLLTQHELWD